MKMCQIAAIGFAAGLAALSGQPLAHGYGQHGGPVVERSAELDIKLRNDRLPVRRILELGPQFEGKRVRLVDIEIRPRGRTTRFLLLGDGRLIGEAWSGRGDSFVRLRPYKRARLGVDFQRLQLAIEGSARIERLSARLGGRRPHFRHWQRGHHTKDTYRYPDETRISFPRAGKPYRW